MHTYYLGIEENRNGQFEAQNCKLYWAHELVNQALVKYIFFLLLNLDKNHIS